MEFKKDIPSTEENMVDEAPPAEDALLDELNKIMESEKSSSSAEAKSEDALNELNKAVEPKKGKRSSKAKAADKPLSADDALFNELSKAKKKKKAKRIRIIIIIVAILLIAGIVGTIVLQRKVRTQFASSSEDVLSAQAKRGSISTVVSGSGTLANVDSETVSVPSGVEVTETLVEYGDIVEVGDPLAKVDMATVRSAISDVQDQIESLDSQISTAESDTVYGNISASVSGRVKKIYAQEGDPVDEVMVKYGSLALLSLDGYMQAEIKTDALATDDTVTVVLSDGTEVEGTVQSVIAKRATILLTDDGPKYEEEVTIRSNDGTELGKATLSIHSPMAVTGYTGTISYVYAEENQEVYSNSTIFSLSDTGTTATYDSLLRSREEYEDTLQELLSLQSNNALVAPIAGSIYYVVDLDEEDDDDDDEEILDIVTISPDKQMEVSITIDESDILSLELGQKADVSVSAVSDEETFDGVVTEIDKTYSSGYYTALITLDKVTGMIPGMTASVDVNIEGVDDAIIIPADALHQISTGYFVYTSYNEDTQEYGGRVDVIPGMSNSNYVEIKSGLNEGDTVYYTEVEEFNFPGMGGGMGGGMPGGMGGNGGGGGMPGGGGGGGMPGGGGGGGMPGGGGFGG